MNLGWIKLTAPQASALDVLNMANPGNNFIRARLGADSNRWICADVLSERHGICAYYGAWLDGLDAPQDAEPKWPNTET